MDYSKIRLKNERNEHVTKRLNRLNTWKFFTVLYRENVWRLFGFSILMLLTILPILVVMLFGNFQNSSLEAQLPMLNGFGFSTGSWIGVEEFYQNAVTANNYIIGLIMVGSAVLVSFMLSGGLAVIRDAFWTGKFSKVGIFRSMGKGIKANFPYAIISTVITAFSVYGLFAFYTWGVTAMPVWLTIVLLVLLCVVALLLVTYLLILCSVSVTYKQSVKENMDDAWRLMWLNILPNIIHLILALLPIGLYFVFMNGMLQSIFMVLILMFGGLYFPLVWQTHMMKTFALFNPVATPKKKGKKGQKSGVGADEISAELPEATADTSTEPQPTKPADDVVEVADATANADVVADADIAPTDVEQADVVADDDKDVDPTSNPKE